MVVTSGIGGVYPKGLPLGRVSSVENADNALYYTIVVDAFASVENQEEVLVITSLTEDQTASADDIAQADDNPAGTAADAGGDDAGATQDAATDESGTSADDGAGTGNDAEGGE